MLDADAHGEARRGPDRDHSLSIRVRSDPILGPYEVTSDAAMSPTLTPTNCSSLGKLKYHL